MTYITYMHACMHTNIKNLHTYTHASTHIHTHTYIHTYIHTYRQTDRQTDRHKMHAYTHTQNSLKPPRPETTDTNGICRFN